MSTIAVTCDNCGKSLKVPDKMAGKKAKCPKCEAAIPVPGGDGKSGASARTSAAKACPECDRPMQKDDVFCVGCGLDTRTGKKIPGLK